MRLGLGVVLAFFVMVSSAAASPCSDLAGDDRAPAADVKLVELGNDKGGTDLVGCVLPDGPVQHIAVAYRSPNTYPLYEYEIEQVAGPVVLLSQLYGYGSGADNDYYVANLATGGRYLLIGTFGPDKGNSGEVPEQVIVNEAGQAVAIISQGHGTSVPRDAYLGAWSADGALTELDRAAEAADFGSLTLSGSVASWTNGGSAHTYDFNGPQSACAALGGKDLSPASDTKLVVAPRPDGGESLRACHLPDGPVTTLGKDNGYEFTEVQSVAGPVVAYTVTTSRENAASIARTKVLNIATGAAYRVEQHSVDDGDALVADRVLVNRAGKAAAELLRGERRLVMGFLADGTRRRLDNGRKGVIPEHSLSFVRSRATWTSGARTRSRLVR